MKKATALTLAGLMAISAASQATMSRKIAFSDSSKFVKDNTNIWTLPAGIADDGDTTYMEWGGGTNYSLTSPSAKAYGNGVINTANVWGGSNMALGGGVLGIWYNRPFSKQTNELPATVAVGAGSSAPGRPAAGVDPTVSAVAFNTPQNQIDLVYGFKAGSADLGVGINRATNSTKNDSENNAGTATTLNSADSFGISLGAALKDLGAIKELDLGLQYDATTLQVAGKDATATFDDKITQAGSEINFRVGADLGGDLIDLNVNSEGRSTKAEPKTAAAADTYGELKESAMDVNLGWAMSKSSDKGMGLGGFILDWMSQSRDGANSTAAKVADKLDVSTLTIKAVAGSEFKAKEWLTLRTGLTGTLYKSTSATLDQSNGATSVTKKFAASSTAGNPAVITIGSSLVLGDVVVDGVANQDFLFSGPYFVSGVPNGLNLQVSATMKWGKGGAKE